MKYCQSCGATMSEQADVCINCGKLVVVNKKNNKYSGLAITGFVLAVISILNPVLFFIGIIALIFSIIGLKVVKKHNLKGKGLAVAGLVISIITTTLFVIFTLLIGLLIDSINNEVSSVQYDTCCLNAGGFTDNGECTFFVESNRTDFEACLDEL